MHKTLENLIIAPPVLYLDENLNLKLVCFLLFSSLLTFLGVILQYLIFKGFSKGKGPKIDFGP